eukprot:SAG11_NODE_5535_length_1532_cov_1.550593_2_plen_75_part_00
MQRGCNMVLVVGGGGGGSGREALGGQHGWQDWQQLSDSEHFWECMGLGARQGCQQQHYISGRCLEGDGKTLAYV